MANIDGLLWLLATLLVFVIIQRRFQRELQAVFLLITRRPQWALVAFSILLFPGVLLHELSHFLAARILGVKTGKFSLLPEMLPDGLIRLGYVETAKVDFLRDSMIGAAPLVTGGILTAFIGMLKLGLGGLLPLLSAGQIEALLGALGKLPALPDFWLWFYLAVAVSTTMLPSPSDRTSWASLGLTFGLLVLVALIAGAGPWLAKNILPYLNIAMRSVSVVFGISLVVHLALLLPVWLLRRLISRATGLTVQGL